MERDIMPCFDFIKDIPAFKGMFDSLNKLQIKLCLEKIKIKLFERGATIYRSKEESKVAYVVMLGIVNLYDDTIDEDLGIQVDEAL